MYIILCLFINLFHHLHYYYKFIVKFEKLNLYSKKNKKLRYISFLSSYLYSFIRKYRINYIFYIYIVLSIEFAENYSNLLIIYIIINNLLTSIFYKLLILFIIKKININIISKNKIVITKSKYKKLNKKYLIFYILIGITFQVLFLIKKKANRNYPLYIYI